MEEAKKRLAELKQVIDSAKEKQKAASAEVKRLDKEMADFKNNKDSKLKEIKVSSAVRPIGVELTARQADIASKKKELGKQTLQVKTRQKEVQTAELEIRKCKP